MPAVSGFIDLRQLVGDAVAVDHVAHLANDATDGAAGDGSGQDGRREEQADEGATNHAPLDAGLGAVLGNRAKVDLALMVGPRDEDAVYLQARRPLQLDQRGVGVLRFFDGRKSGHDEAVCAIADQADYRFSVLLVGCDGRGRKCSRRQSWVRLFLSLLCTLESDGQIAAVNRARTRTEVRRRN